MTLSLTTTTQSPRLYPLMDRLQKCAAIRYPHKPWTTEMYHDFANAWMGKEDELEKRVLKHEKEISRL